MQKNVIECDYPIKALFLDYDGTISPLRVPRKESRVPAGTLTALSRISEKIPVVVVTSKPSDFVIPRTPFATAWSTINGLETRIGNRVLDTSFSEQQIKIIVKGLKYAKSKLVDTDAEIEEKELSDHQVVGFCVDWRQAKDPKETKRKALQVAKHLETLPLYVSKFPAEPFYDVYLLPAHKGQAVETIRKRLGLENGVAYMGDSEMDNPAFLISDLSIGVICGETQPHLHCDYYVQFADVASFLEQLLENSLTFHPSFLTAKA